MFAKAILIAIVSTPLWLFATAADAQRVHPRCVKAKDKVRCSCALSNGALIRHIPGRGRVIMLRDSEQHVNERYIKCMLRHGRS